MSWISICKSHTVLIRHRFPECPRCEDGEVRAVIHQPGSVYYDARISLECGDMASDGVIEDRPFIRGWREKAKRAF